MEHVNSFLTSNLDVLVVYSLLFLAVALVMLTAAAIFVVPQASRTLHAYENLADTLEKELGPTLQEVQKVVTSVKELRHVAEKQITQVGTKVEDVTDSVGKVATSAKKESQVFGSGLLAGIKAYINGAKKGNDNNKGDESELGRQVSEQRQVLKGPR